MEKELNQLKEAFSLINLKAFCKAFNLQYDYVRQILSGKFGLSERLYHTLRQHLKYYFERNLKTIQMTVV